MLTIHFECVERTCSHYNDTNHFHHSIIYREIQLSCIQQIIDKKLYQRILTKLD